MPNSLLPPNATPFERALEAVTARIGDVSAPIDTLIDPANIEADLLPWLGWALSLDTWDAGWSEADKRAAVAGSIALHRVKGTRRSVEVVLRRFDELLRIVEWHETIPRGMPHTFTIDIPMVDASGAAPGGRRSTAAFADAIIREITRVKPLREHLELVQSVTTTGSIGVQAVIRAVLFSRQAVDLVADTSEPWALLLQTEDGEPIENPAGGFLETAS